MLVWGYELNNAQALLINGKYFTDEAFFAVLYSVNATPFIVLSQQDIAAIQGGEYSWVLTLTYKQFDLPTNVTP